jgi:hypothetical protein
MSGERHLHVSQLSKKLRLISLFLAEGFGGVGDPAGYIKKGEDSPRSGRIETIGREWT